MTARARAGRADGIQLGVLVHDLNNLLAVIIGANEALADGLAANSPRGELARMSRDAAEQAAALIARAQPVASTQHRPADVADARDAALAVARRLRLTARDGVEVSVEAPDETLMCALPAAELDAALLNLALNAKHALGATGSIHIHAERCGAEVVLRVTDSGHGMTPDILALCLATGFTTRADRGGSGLGLAGVRAAMRRCGGSLELASRRGAGVTASLRLPAVQAADKVIRIRSERLPARIFDITLAR